MRVALIAAVTLAALPQAAWGATVSLTYEEPIPGLEPESVYALNVKAARNEANRLWVLGDPDGFSVTDDGAPLSAGPGCQQVTATEVRCPTPQSATTTALFVGAGNRSDQVVLGQLVEGTETEVRAGPGNDIVYGTEGDDLLYGGSGDDGLLGGPGMDMLDGAEGNDVMQGGDGPDSGSYQTRRAPVAVDLQRNRAEIASLGEEDALYGIEKVVGGRGADVLRGDSGPNTLVGGEGNSKDVIDGRDGDDIVIGHRASGGPGNDSIDSQLARCGPGHDAVYRLRFKPRGWLEEPCEFAVDTFVFVSPNPVKRAGRGVYYRVGCRAERCRGTLELLDARGRLGIGHFDAGREDGVPVLERVRVGLTRRPATRIATLRIRGPRVYDRDSFQTRLR